MPSTDRALAAVLFDAVGTLIELCEPVGETYARIAGRYGASISAWRLGDAFDRILAAAPPPVFPDAAPADVAQLEREWWRDVVRSTLRAADSATAVADFDAYFDTLFQHYATAEAWRPRTGALECLRALRERGVACGMVSNFDLRLPDVLDAIGLARWLDVVVVPGRVGAAKPDPAPFRAALEALDCPANASVYVGDDPIRDAAGARAAGLRAIDVNELATLAELPARLAEPME